MFDAQQYKNEYNKNNYERIYIRVPKSKKEVLEELSKNHNKSINRLTIEALEKTYNIDLTIVESKLTEE
jgi:hypothetical protein